MAKEELFEFNGTVKECLPNTLFRVEVPAKDDQTLELIATISGKMRKNNIRVLQGDAVVVEVSPYDLTRGRIIFRHK